MFQKDNLNPMSFIKVNNRYEKSIEYQDNMKFNSKLFGLQKKVN